MTDTMTDIASRFAGELTTRNQVALLFEMAAQMGHPQELVIPIQWAYLRVGDLEPTPVQIRPGPSQNSGLEGFSDGFNRRIAEDITADSDDPLQQQINILKKDANHPWFSYF